MRYIACARAVMRETVNAITGIIAMERDDAIKLLTTDFLNLLLDVFIVGKLGIPGYEELAMGAIASGGVRVVNADVVRHLRRAEELLEIAAKKETAEIERREREYRNGRPPRELRGCTVILIDDGLATGSTMSAAVLALRQREAAKIVVAVPVGPPETCSEFEREVDETICAIEPETFYAVGQFYDDFSQTTDEEVRELLSAAAKERRPKAAEHSNN